MLNKRVLKPNLIFRQKEATLLLAYLDYMANRVAASLSPRLLTYAANAARTTDSINLPKYQIWF